MITSLHRGLRPSVPLTSAIKKLTAHIRQTACVNMSMKAIVFHENGDSSKLSFEDVPVPEAGEGEVCILTDGFHCYSLRDRSFDFHVNVVRN